MAPTHSGSQGPTRILLIEDAVDHALLVQILLRKAGGFVTTHCQDGHRAVELLQSEPFDLVITDLNLPGSDGLQIIRYAKSTRPHVPVLVTTGYTDPDYAYHAYRAGADEVLLKPVDRDELLRSVRNALGRETGGEERGLRGVLAVGARPGDVESGAAGALLVHRDRGEPVSIVLLVRPDDALERMARESAEALDARLLVPDTEVNSNDTAALQDFLRRTVGEVGPHAVYLPSAEDEAPDRRAAERVIRPTLEEVRNVIAYPTATVGFGFRPNRFVILSQLMPRKLAALAAYRGSDRPELGASFAKASARYWGRLAEFMEVEPLEVLRNARDAR